MHKDENIGVSPTFGKQMLAAVLFLLIIGGVYKFGKSLNRDIQYSKEIDSLQKEKLRLEIQLKKLELSKNCR